MTLLLLRRRRWGAGEGGFVGRQALCQGRGGEENEKNAQKTCFFCSNATSLKFPKQFHKPQNFFHDFFVFENMAIINKLVTGFRASKPVLEYRRLVLVSRPLHKGLCLALDSEVFLMGLVLGPTKLSQQ